jgi:hypothetical protein
MRLLIIFIISISSLVSCGVNKPKNFVNTQEDGVWRSVNIHNNYGLFRPKNPEVWRRVIDVLSEKYDILMSDRASGYIRTDWKKMPVTDKQYQTRIIVKMQGRVWHTAKLKIEARWREDNDDSWIMGYDKVVMNEIYRDIQGRLGTSVR